MELIADWARQIAAYLIFGSVLSNLIRKQNYLKYVRLVMGIVLIVLLATPMLKLWGQVENYQFHLSRYLLIDEAKDGSFICDINERKEKMMLREVENAVKERIVWIVDGYGLEVMELSLRFCTQEAEYGVLEEINMVLEADTGSYTVFGTDSPDTIRIRDQLAEELGTEKSNISITIY